ncbi:MAG: endonuclease [Gammaproteobacteria bacterium]|nr:endonuclease [Gammaproteobacteria bacterium]
MRLQTLYRSLYRQHGAQHWWPGETPFEVMVGAVLTQNTAWRNVERAIANLRAVQLLSPTAITGTPHARLAQLLRPSGYFNVKARRLHSYCRWYNEQGGFDALTRLDTARLRTALLAVHGIGPETADDILLYAFQRPVFVVDAYTRRLLSRLALIQGNESYETLRATIEGQLGRADRLALFNEFHALIVMHAKHVCKPRPACTHCCVARRCPAATS